MRRRVVGLLVAGSVAVSAVVVAVGGGENYAGTPTATPTGTPGAGCDLNATTGTFAAQFAAATAGQTVCLASGAYGTFTGGTKSSPGVTVKPAGGAVATMNVDFAAGDSWITLEGLGGMGGTVFGTANNITVRDSDFTSRIHISTTGANAAIMLDNIRVPNITPGGDVAGRVHIDASGVPSGVTVKNSTIGPGGYADGIRADANGIQILNNRFVNIQDAEPHHGDPIQVFGGSDLLIQGNYFDQNDPATTGLTDRYVAAMIQVTGGAVGLDIVNNIFRAGSYTDAINLGVDSSGNPSTVVHNTFEATTARAACGGYQQRCGLVSMESSVTTFRNNITGLLGGGTATYNLTYAGSASGTNILGVPSFVGGSNPTSVAGMALAIGSPGKAAASDGTDIGADVSSVGPQ